MRPILLVEDDRNDLSLMQLAMERAGITDAITVLRDGRSVVDWLADPHNPAPYLILLDLKIPGIPGLDVLRWIRNRPRLAGTVVLVLSSLSVDADVEAVYRLRANGYLVKGATLNELVDMLTAIKHFWLQHNQAHPKFNNAGPKEDEYLTWKTVWGLK